MHPILGNWRRLAIYVFAWLLVGLLLAVGLRRETSWATALVVFLPPIVVYAFITLSAWYVCRAFPLPARSRLWNVLFAHGLAAAFTSLVWVGLVGVWSGLVDRATGGDEADRLYAEHLPLLFVVGALLFWLAAVFHYLLIAFEASREAETRALESSLLTREAELKAVRAQINPHFIFNSLHSISALTAIDPPAARRMCLLLADLLRDTLRHGSSARITLAEELALAGRFLAIEQVRLGDRLQLSQQVEDDAARCLVPPLLLQPLVENAVIHGVAQLVEGGTIRVMAARTVSTLTIAVENPCDPDRQRTRGTGLGIALLRQRLAADFGTYDAVRTTEERGSFRVELRLPAMDPAPAAGASAGARDAASSVRVQ